MYSLIYVPSLVTQVSEKFIEAGKAMWTTLKFPLVWRPCLYMYLSFLLSLDIREGLFYWYTDAKAGPSFSQVWTFLTATCHVLMKNPNKSYNSI